MDTVRDVMIDRIKDILEIFVQLPPDKQQAALRATAIDIADDAFSVCGISEKEPSNLVFPYPISGLVFSWVPGFLRGISFFASYCSFWII